MPKLVLGVRDLVGVEVDVLVVGVTTDGSNPRAVPGLEVLDKAFEGRLDQALEEVGASGSVGETVRLPSLGAVSARTVLGVGLGGGHVTVNLLRDAAGTAVRAVEGARSVAIALPARTPDEVGAVGLARRRSSWCMSSWTTRRPTTSRPWPPSPRRSASRVTS